MQKSKYRQLIDTARERLAGVEGYDALPPLDQAKLAHGLLVLALAAGTEVAHGGDLTPQHVDEAVVMLRERPLLVLFALYVLSIARLRRVAPDDDDPAAAEWNKPISLLN